MVEWLSSKHPVDVDEAVQVMEARAAAIADGTADEAVWLLEHPMSSLREPAARIRDILAAATLPVKQVSRGGQVTYHGPGQRIAYLMLDLNERGRDVRRFVRSIEYWIIASLLRFGIVGEVRDERVGVWVRCPDGTESKIAAIGIRLRRWVSLHGASINLCPNLSHYRTIVPCGIQGYGITSIADLGFCVSQEDLDRALKEEFAGAFPNIASWEKTGRQTLPKKANVETFGG